MKSQTSRWDFSWAFGWRQSLKIGAVIQEQREKTNPSSVRDSHCPISRVRCPPLPAWPSSPPATLSASFAPCYFQSWKCSSRCSGTLWRSLRQMGRLIDRGLLRSQRAPEKQESLKSPKCSFSNARSCCFMIKVTSPSVSSLCELSPNSTPALASPRT